MLLVQLGFVFTYTYIPAQAHIYQHDVYRDAFENAFKSYQRRFDKSKMPDDSERTTLSPPIPQFGRSPSVMSQSSVTSSTRNSSPPPANTNPTKRRKLDPTKILKLKQKPSYSGSEMDEYLNNEIGKLRLGQCLGQILMYSRFRS